MAVGRLTIEGGTIVAVELDEGSVAAKTLSYLAPGFVDVHVHGGGGHDAMGDAADLDGMARHLLRHGVTSFLPTAVTAPLPSLVAFAERVRAWLPGAPADGAEPLGFNLEGPFLADARRGAHDPTHLRAPADVPSDDLEPLVDGLRLVTIAPELPGALDLIPGSASAASRPSMGHSAATVDEARAGYRGRRILHDPPVQRDDRRRPPLTGARRRRAARRRRFRRAHRRRRSTSIRRSGR